jgi:hypothetical protein
MTHGPGGYTRGPLRCRDGGVSRTFWSPVGWPLGQIISLDRTLLDTLQCLDIEILLIPPFSSKLPAVCTESSEYYYLALSRAPPIASVVGNSIAPPDPSFVAAAALLDTLTSSSFANPFTHQPNQLTTDSEPAKR